MIGGRKKGQAVFGALRWRAASCPFPPASASVCDNFRRRFNESEPAENGREKTNLINWEFVYQLENGQFGHFLPLFI